MGTLRVVALLSLSLFGNGLWAQKTKPANGLEAGLKGEYFNGPNFERKVMTRTDPQVDFNWNWQSPGPDVQREYFSVRWTGKLYAPTSGTYRFSATVDDGVRVWVNGRKVIDEWRKQDDSNFVGEISLTGKKFYDLRIDYYNDWKGSVISVFWESPDDRRLLSFVSRPTKTIPATYLFRKPDRPVQTSTASAKPLPNVAKHEPVRTLPVAGRSATFTAKPTALKSSVSLPKRNVVPITAVVASMPQPKSQTNVTQTAVLTPFKEEKQPFDNLKLGETIVFRRVTFAQSEYTLLPESHAELDKLVNALLLHPNFQIEIAGHTDNVGDKRLNQTLSEFRAKVVASYLCRHGIADSRVTFKGYGGSQPIADNASETLRAQNRRVEFTVTKQ
ncbi:PA14 domain-containing protein [Spirosoma sp.]|uniref:PA14 domain-containing protein n=1 Tax=Spirosoma sp. TaxID=1899569 RepID=UPI003B3AD229